ncbi:MAG: NUDIX domain-containing protein [Methanomassiliicoccaceae archaeon]|nr:NUDIX domain-containing protein [Methanomassiliicoccaceae archaeon]
MDSIFDYEHPFVCTDAVIFTVKTEESDNYRKLPGTDLQILLYKRTAEPYRGKWCLPGGFLNIDEMPEDNIRRKMSEKSYVDECWLEQLYTFCDLKRDPRARVLSIAYLGLMNEAGAMKYEDKAVWFTVVFDAGQKPTFRRGDLLLKSKDIGFDHLSIIEAALERMRSKILYTDIVFNLLPEEFTLTQLQNVYETILGKKDQAANFRRKIVDMVQETDRYTGDKGHRPARLYTKRKEVQ